MPWEKWEKNTGVVADAKGLVVLVEVRVREVPGGSVEQALAPPTPLGAYWGGRQGVGALFTAPPPGQAKPGGQGEHTPWLRKKSPAYVPAPQAVGMGVVATPRAS